MRPTVLPLLLTALIGVTSAYAGPTTGDTPENVSTPDGDVRSLPDRIKRSEGTTGTRTIDLLIDMQPRGAGLQFNERQPATRSNQAGARQAPAAAAAPEANPAGQQPPMPGVARRVEPPPVSTSGLFGSGATPPVQSARMNSAAEPRFAPGTDTGPARRPAATPDQAQLPVWLLFPREVIEYVRDNRWLVLGSVGAGLIVIWALSAMFARAASGAGRVSGAHGARADAAFSEGRWRSDRQSSRPTRQHSRRHRH